MIDASYMGGALLLADQDYTPLLALGLVFVVVVLTVSWYRSMRRKRLIEDVPTSKVKGVAIGLSEVKGVARRAEPLRSYLAGRSTVWYRYSIEEHWERTVTETYTDSDGKTQTRTRRESGWKTVQDDTITGLFFLEDDTGSIRVDPRRATIEGELVFSETCRRGDPLYYGKGPVGGVSDSTGKRRFTEHAIVIGDDLYVMGSARLRDDAVAAELAYDADDPLYLISTRDESKIASGCGVKAFFFALFGLVFSVGAAVLFTSNAYRLEPDDPVVIRAAAGAGLGYLLLLALLYAMLLYNGLVMVSTRIGKAWALIEVQLQRRADLVPRLAAVVQGYADHERAVQAGLAELRSGAVTGRGRAPKRGAVAAAERAADRQTALLDRLLAVVEAYPDLKANTLYLDLQWQLADAEDRIALARSFYNETVTAYNVRIQSLPDVLFARPMGFRRVPTYTIEAFERRPVAVEMTPARLVETDEPA